MDTFCLQNELEPFSEQIFKVLIKKVDQSKSDKISISDFLDSYVDGDIRIKSKHSEVIKMMARRMEKREQNVLRLN